MTTSEASGLQGSARRVFELYLVLMALALENAVQEAFTSFSWPRLCLTASTVVTLIPFFHGALRHVDEYYLVTRPRPVRRYTLFWDFIFLFLQAIVFFGLAAKGNEPRWYALFLSTLLVLDIVWGVMVDGAGG